VEQAVVPDQAGRRTEAAHSLTAPIWDGEGQREISFLLRSITQELSATFEAGCKVKKKIQAAGIAAKQC